MTSELYLGLDIGGTKVEGAIALIDPICGQIQVYSQKKILLEKPTTYENFLDSVFGLICTLVSESKIEYSSLKALGAGLPGSIDPKTNVMLNGNTIFLIGKNFVSDLNEKLFNKFKIRHPLFVNNDANLFALAEGTFGVGRKFYEQRNIAIKDQVLVGITLGTGVGGGAVSEGKILHGAHGSSLEVGHISLDPKGPRCYCGQNGCAEIYLSGTGLQKMNSIESSIEIFKKAELGDLEALEILKEYRAKMIHFLSILNNLFNPHYFVFGGGLSQQKVLFQDLHSDLKEKIFLTPEFCPEIYTFQLGDSAGLFGAMLYANEKLS